MAKQEKLKILAYYEIWWYYNSEVGIQCGPGLTALGATLRRDIIEQWRITYIQYIGTYN